MARRLLNLLTLLSLLLSVAAASAWALTRSERSITEFHVGGVWWVIDCGGGRLTLHDTPRWRAEWHEVGRTLSHWIAENERRSRRTATTAGWSTRCGAATRRGRW